MDNGNLIIILNSEGIATRQKNYKAKFGVRTWEEKFLCWKSFSGKDEHVDRQWNHDICLERR